MTSPSECADAVGRPISAFGTTFMLDPGFYAPAIDVGYSGLDFYIAGRGGVLGDVDADVVSAAFGFLAPEIVRLTWEGAREVAPVADALSMFAAGAAEWGRRHFVADIDYHELTRLCRRVIDAAPIAGLPLFAGWRNVPAPDDGPGSAALAMNVMRELRGGAHLLAVIAAGITPREAAHHAGGEGYATMMGHQPPFAEVDDIGPTMAGVERTTTAIVTPGFEVLDGGEADRLIELVTAATSVEGVTR